jgi:hypothetical protein
MSIRGLSLVTAATLLAPIVAPGLAAAGDNDLVMSRLARVVERDGVPVDVVGQNLDFRSMVSELGVVLAPRLLAPSDTVGFGGFQFSTDLAFSSISSDAGYWRVLEGSDDPLGSGSHGASQLSTVGVFARKGLWFPVPSVEIAGGAVHLMDSRMWAPQAYVKVALVEGYHELPIPSVAVRGAVSRLMGSRELDLTVASLDLSVSKHVGVGGTWSIDPYGGWNLLFIVPRSEVIDATPGIDPLGEGNADDRNLNFVLKDQDDILRHRFFVGAKMQYYVFALTLEANFALAGSSTDDRDGDMDCTVNAMTEACDATDQSAAQQTFTASLGLDF